MYWGKTVSIGNHSLMRSNYLNVKYTVVLVGLGDIGSKYDQSLSEDDFILTHLRAFQLHPDFALIAGIDSSAKVREDFQRRSGIKAFESVTEILSEIKVDVVVIATPTHTHLEIIDQIFAISQPKLILCEKPLAGSTEEAKSIVEKCNKNNTQLFVNYIRRADPGVIEVKNRIMSGNILEPYKGIVWYSKGLLHNGTHFLDLMIFWFGPVISWSIISAQNSVPMGRSEPDVLIKFHNISIIFCSANEDNYSHYTVELIAKNGRLRYESNGKIFWQTICREARATSRKQLTSQSEEFFSDMGRYQFRIASEISLAIKSEPNVLCGGDEALENIFVLNEILHGINNYLGE